MRLPAVLSWLFLMAIYSLFLTISVFGLPGQCSSNQKSLLLQLKNNLTFDPTISTKLVKWNRSFDCCSWEGITCNEGHVIGLDLTNESISGGLDNSNTLFSLQHLQSLSLAFNDFDNSQIPSKFGKLKNLSYLNLSNAGFAEQIPIAISHLTRLVTLDLSINNGLYLEKPNLNMLLRNLSKLIELYLDGVAISAQGNKWCQVLSSSLPNLRVLSLSNCNLSGPIDSSLRNLKSLSIIRLNYNDFSAPVPEFFADFKNLTSLEVSSSGLNGKFSKKIFQIPTLRTLDLSYNDLQGSLPHSIGNLTQLVYLDMSSNMFSGLIPVFSMAKNLTKLDLSSNNLTGQIASTQWAELLNLEILDLSDNSLNGDIPISLFSLPSLQPSMRLPAVLSWLFLMAIYSLFLTISVFGLPGQCSSNQKSLLLQLKNNLTFDPTISTKLVKWNRSFDCCSWEGITCNEGHVIGLDLTNESISGGLDNSNTLFSLQHLQSLSLAFNDFDNSQIPSKFGKLKNLSYLNLSNAGFAEQIPIAISHLTRLVTLDLSINNGLYLEKPNLNMLLRNLSKLIELYLDGVAISAQGNKWCQVLSSSLPNLRVLSLSNCNLSGPIDSSLRNLKSLSIIRLNYNDFSAPVPEFFADFKNLTSLEVSSSGLNGKFSKKIFQIPTLRTLDLSYNDLQGSLPHSIGNLTQLVYLDMSSNMFSGLIPVFSMAKNLTKLDLSSNNLTGQIASTQWAELLNLEILDLSDNSLNGDIPISLFSLPSLQVLQLSNNQFSGQLKEFSNISSYMLQELDLSNNDLEGPIPMSIFELRGLEILSLSSNNFDGSNLLIEYSGFNLSSPPFPQIASLGLASSKLEKIPDFLRNQSSLYSLDLSKNQIYGEMPNWIWKLPQLRFLNLSYNLLVTLEGPILNLSLPVARYLDFRSNQFHGQLPVLPLVSYLDFSMNNFHSAIPASIGQSLDSTQFFSISSNKLYGSIPVSICNATYLRFLDMSDNYFSGKIPQCLIEMSGTLLQVLSLRRNNLSGTIPDTFPESCYFQTLVINENHLEGELPKFLANCHSLEVLDVGNNHIEDTFPFYLNGITILKVLILRSNKFYGLIAHPKLDVPWPMLQILDVASNNFTGKLPIILLSTWMAVMDNAHEATSELNHIQVNIGSFYYRDMVIVITKGLEVELVKILNIFTTIDFSCNNFEGAIPEEIGEFTLLYNLNLSHNAFTGKIPASLGKLSHLESLDLSSNKLTGEIPMQLANGLIFLSVLNLSFNQLVGQIPFIKQFATFSENCFKGNERLCGFPLKSQCSHEEPRLSPPAYEESHSNSGTVIEWNYISAELGFVFGFGIIIGPLMFWKKWKIWYYKHVDDIGFRIFPKLYLRNEHRQRRAFRNQEPRR
ncbi:receptor-like protein 7 [Corylus avellana]|uniref:receptor-like protein 7 n=1 Tax=Corylus avellana TaxID=13451 RepID=UPI00286C0C9A|nr:receptor-like protein 7 [Corylus avellana]